MVSNLLLCLLAVCITSGFAAATGASPKTGPCILNDNGMNCTSQGYYETVQCKNGQCFCVTAHTGWVAYDTTTNSEKVAPKCGSCLLELQKTFAKGDPPVNMHIAKCELGKGNYEPLQCDTKKEECYCVDESTGKEKPGTRKPLKNSEKMMCNQIEFSIDAAEFPTFDKDAVAPDNVGQEICKPNRDRGRKCSEKKPSIKWFFDKKSFTCLAFEHLGCGGNSNVFDTKDQCMSSCVMADYMSCGLQTPPAMQSNGQIYSCGGPVLMALPGAPTTPKPIGPALDEDGCPKGYTCQRGAFFGFCCNIKDNEKSSEAWSPKCKNGKTPKYTVNYYRPDENFFKQFNYVFFEPPNTSILYHFFVNCEESDGPCVGNQNDMTCDTFGYYNPNSVRNKSPKCGNCLIELQRIFAAGDPPPNVFIPKCDVGLGDYEPLQCDAHKNECFCVDTKTGKEIESKFKDRSLGYTTDPSAFPTIDKIGRRKNKLSLGLPVCQLDRSKGYRCAERKPGVKYFFDQQTATCLAFEHLGCGGNLNSFNTKRDCVTMCRLADYFACGLQSEPALQSSGEVLSCGPKLQISELIEIPDSSFSGPILQDGCPTGYKCFRAPFMSFCCNIKDSEKSREGWSVKCGNGKNAKSSREHGYDEFLLGKSCLDDFCPKDHTCEDNFLFAFCCPK
ncbi:unnamed protein product [Caenorhabditis auriculariae]|uniref:Kunitz/Bovine pancreatic trypsin inhibitor domain protein n=1 Tax=Caenorhabditis auriculariae TaxID=2777116 RepID=A0A8S1HAX9_9PELO|nr:unnamed protein product [Caenorhabditis auriculariae]